MPVSIIIPAYNEEQRLRPFLTSLVHYIAAHPNDIGEIIVVDDGSTDQTVAIAQSFAPQLSILRLIPLTSNQGKGAAVQAGVLAATGEYIVFMDADGATPITELPLMITALKTAPIAVGNRWLPGADATRHSQLRRLAGWVYRQYMRLFGLGNIDTMCGFKGYQRDVAQKLFKNLQEKRWLFDTEIAYKSVRAGYRTACFPIKWESKDGSKLSTLTLLHSALAIWPLIRRLRQETT